MMSTTAKEREIVLHNLAKKIGVGDEYWADPSLLNGAIERLSSGNAEKTFEFLVSRLHSRRGAEEVKAVFFEYCSRVKSELGNSILLGAGECGQ